MLRSLNELDGFVVEATDGAIGEVVDCYFDDTLWVVRYLIVETGTWLARRQVLISPVALGHPDWLTHLLPVALTRSEVKDSPPIDTQKPVSRQVETQYLAYYGYPAYWGGSGLWGGALYPNGPNPIAAGGSSHTRFGSSPAEAAAALIEAERTRIEDPHLRAAREVTHYHVEASDGEMGRVQGFLIEDETWALRYLIVETGHWWHGHQVLIAPQWIERVSWAHSTLYLALTQAAVRGAHTYDPAQPLERESEASLHRHYGRTGYWEAEAQAELLGTEHS